MTSRARLRLWIKWSSRDLRRRWTLVVATALIIALGTGTYAGLASTADWRFRSADASYAITAAHDLRVTLTRGSFLPAGTLLSVAARSSLEVAAAEERLVVPTQLEATTPTGIVRVPGRIVGAVVAPEVDRVFITSGRALDARDEGQPTAVLEHNFADYHELPESGSVRISGGERLGYVGTGHTPEYFVVTTPQGGLYAHARYAVAFTSLETAQSLSGLPDVVNDMVLTLVAGTDRAVAAAILDDALAVAVPESGALVETIEEDSAWIRVYEDIEGDQKMFNVFAFAIFAGAVFAAFNLTTRMVESQRREIGNAMALGVPPGRIALRPLLGGAQIALLGVVLGVAVGFGIAALLRGVLESFLPLPVWETPFQPGIFAAGAAVGFVVPLAAIVYPIWRAVRVPPVEAIRTGHLVAKGTQLTRMLRRLPFPGDTFAQLPFRNLVRAPRRAVLTLLGIAAVITVMVGVVGMLDSYLRTIDLGEAEELQGRPDALAVEFDVPYPENSPPITTVADHPSVADGSPALTLGGELIGGEERFETFLYFRDFSAGRWEPTLLEGAATAPGPGVVLARKAADDLGLGVGDVVTVRHPQRTGPLTLGLVESELPVVGVHTHPYRFVTYLDMDDAAITGLDGLANYVYLDPAPGLTDEDVVAALFDIPGVASASRVALAAEVARDLIGQILGMLAVVEGVVLLLALLIAFNATSLNMDERARDHATALAFGVRPRTIMRMAIVESATIGVLATALGLGGGYLLLMWLVGSLVPQITPDLWIPLTLGAQSMAIVLGLGIVAVAIAPLLNTRRLLRTDVPSTLRVME